MRVLFVVGGNSEKFEIPPLVRAQGDSLNKLGINVIYFSITGKGALGYLKNIFDLRKAVKENEIDLIHAHYSYSGLLVKLSFLSVPIVVSFMGSDVMGNELFKKVILRLERILFDHHSIVKSKKLNDRKSIQSVVIPNGVNITKFRPMDGKMCKQKLGWNIEKKHILFAANPLRTEKNFKLAKDAFDLLSRKDLELHYLDGVDHEMMPTWFNAADIIVLSSLWEGSPNVIKEAMACKRPIVSTDVGDTEWLFRNTPGNYLANFDPVDFASKLEKAIEFTSKYKNTEGRKRIIDLELDEDSIAQKILNEYKIIAN